MPRSKVRPRPGMHEGQRKQQTESAPSARPKKYSLFKRPDRTYTIVPYAIGMGLKHLPCQAPAKIKATCLNPLAAVAHRDQGQTLYEQSRLGRSFTPDLHPHLGSPHLGSPPLDRHCLGWGPGGDQRDHATTRAANSVRTRTSSTLRSSMSGPMSSTCKAGRCAMTTMTTFTTFPTRRRPRAKPLPFAKTPAHAAIVHMSSR